MSDDTFDLPVRKASVHKVVSREEPPSLKITQKHVDQVVGAAARVLPDLSHIAKDLVAIARIRQQADADVRVIEAETEKIRVRAQAEIERLVQVDQNMRTRAQAAIAVLAQLKQLLETIPDIDTESRRSLIGLLPSLVPSADR